jgi:hypothetical protein
VEDSSLKYSQLPLIATDENISPDGGSEKSHGLTHQSFSYNHVCAQEARLELEKRYAFLLEETNEFNRKLVSYQGNKDELTVDITNLGGR